MTDVGRRIPFRAFARRLAEDGHQLLKQQAGMAVEPMRCASSRYNSP